MVIVASWQPVIVTQVASVHSMLLLSPMVSLFSCVRKQRHLRRESLELVRTQRRVEDGTAVEDLRLRSIRNPGSGTIGSLLRQPALASLEYLVHFAWIRRKAYRLLFGRRLTIRIQRDIPDRESVSVQLILHGVSRAEIDVAADLLAMSRAELPIAR